MIRNKIRPHIPHSKPKGKGVFTKTDNSSQKAYISFSLIPHSYIYIPTPILVSNVTVTFLSLALLTGLDVFVVNISTE